MSRRKTSGSKTNVPGPWTLGEVVELATRHNLAEIEVESNGTRIRVVREHAFSGPAVRTASVPSQATPERPAAVEEAAGNLVTVEAPMVGTFYRASGPDAAPFINEGDVIKEGQVLGIIEAMKLMNEIEAKAAGRVAKILVENGQPVEYGQALLLVEPRR